MKLYSRPGQWWNAPPDEMFAAYYMNLRINYEMPALEAFQYAKTHGPSLGVGVAGGIITVIKEALHHN